MYYDTISIKSGLCPSDCNACITACPKKTSNGLAGIKKVQLLNGTNGIKLCNQCSQPKCVDACTTGALQRNDRGVVELDQDLCVACGACIEECPYDGIYMDDEVVKCDYCNGSPKCVEACPNGVITYKSSKAIIDCMPEKDLLSPGLTFCAGCTAELAVRFTVRVLGQKVIMFGAPSCCLLNDRAQTPYYGCLMTNVSSNMTGVKRYLKRIGKDYDCVAFVGDGTSGDVGYQTLSGAVERGENLIHICYDNEAYMNTGIQRSSSTPMGAWTTTTQVGTVDKGKERPPKYLPLLFALQGASYVATATLSHLEDYAAKLRKAQNNKEGFSYIHLLSPCPIGWQAKEETMIDICRAAVDTNYFPLWEAENGKFRMTETVQKQKPITEFLNFSRRFKHLDENQIERLQEFSNKRFRLMSKLCSD
jgi:phenylglyoxylate dehydrogenase beta subunit